MTWGKNPTRRELQALANALLFGRKEAAMRMGIKPTTLRNHLTSLNERLEVNNMREAAIALGWLDVPAEHVTTGRYSLPQAERHHERSEQLLAYADAILREMENR